MSPAERRHNYLDWESLAALADVTASLLKTDEPLSCREIGDLLDLSHETVRTIERRALKKLASLAAGHRP